MIKEILAVTDFSKHSLKVFPPTIYFARRFKARILLCHVDEEGEFFSPHSSADIEEFLTKVEKAKTRWLDELTEQISDCGVECKLVRLRGYASKEIIKYATRTRVDLTAISTLGAEGLKRLLIGSTASNVLRHLPRPVLCVGAHCSPPDPFKVEKILYPTDFSDISRYGVYFAARLARYLSAELDLIYVLKIPSFIPGLPGEPPIAVPANVVGHLETRFEVLLEDLAEALPRQKVNWEVSIAADEAEEICAFAARKKIDLIVIPKRGEGVLAGLLFGRVAESVAKSAPVPTIVFEPEELMDQEEIEE